MDWFLEELKAIWVNQMIIACLKGNPSNQFYKHIGGEYVKGRIYQRLKSPENVYYDKNI